MMSSRQTSNIKNQLVIASAIFILAVLSWFFFPTPLQSLGSLLFGPMMKTESVIHSSVQEGEENTGMGSEEELRYLRAENTLLKEQLGHEEEPRIAAGVIGRPTALPYDVLVIDRGERDGVVKDAPVYAGDYQVIGFVAAVYEQSAVIALVTTPGFTSTVYVYGPNIYTTAIGQGGGVVRIHVPQGVSLNNGDVVVIPSLTPGVFGTIRAVDSVPSRPEQYGYVTGDTPINSLRFVTVGTRPLSTIGFDEAKTIVDNVRQELLQVPVPEEILIEAESEVATSTTATSTEPVEEE